MTTGNKQLILIGYGSYFTDSLKYFSRRGYKLICLKLSRSVPWFDNYATLKSLGFEFIEYRGHIPEEIVLSRESIVLRGTYSGDGDVIPDILKEIIKDEIDIFNKLSKINYEKKIGAKCALFFCGDNIYKSRDYIEWFEDKIKYATHIFFDNSLLEKYFCANIRVGDGTKVGIKSLELPLEENILHNKEKITSKKVLVLGRFISTKSINSIPDITGVRFKCPVEELGIKNKFFYKFVKKFVYRNIEDGFFLSGRSADNILRLNRKVFFKFCSGYQFGLSHLYNIFDYDYNIFLSNKSNFLFKYDRYFNSISESDGTMYPFIYALINTPNKDITYLMNGIIPLIPHIEHSFYKELFDKKMAVLVNSLEDIEKVKKMDPVEIQEYRNNIYENRNIFSFENTGKMLCESYCK